MAATGSYLFVAPESYDQSVIDKKWKDGCRAFFSSLAIELMNIDEFETPRIDETIKTVAAAHQLKPGDIMQLLRVIISGQGGGVDLLGMIALLGKTEINNRIEKALGAIQK